MRQDPLDVFDFDGIVPTFDITTEVEPIFGAIAVTGFELYASLSLPLLTLGLGWLAASTLRRQPAPVPVRVRARRR